MRLLCDDFEYVTLLYYIFLTLLGCCNCLWVLVIVWQIDPWNIPSFSDVATTSSGTSTTVVHLNAQSRIKSHQKCSLGMLEHFASGQNFFQFIVHPVFTDGILSTSEQTWSPFPYNIPSNSLAIWPIVDCVPSKRSRVKESCGEVQSFRIGETAAIPGSCSYAAASGNSKIIWISRITPFTPQPHFYLLPAPIFLNFIKLHFTHISPFLSQYSPPRNSPWGFHTVDLGGVTGVELLPNLRTWRLHYLTAPGTCTHTHTLLHLTDHAPWPEVCTYNWEDVPACSHIRPIFPYSILRLHQIFPYRSAYTECGNCVDGGKLWLRPV